jgi:hypothetical protein
MLASRVTSSRGSSPSITAVTSMLVSVAAPP